MSMLSVARLQRVCKARPIGAANPQKEVYIEPDNSGGGEVLNARRCKDLGRPDQHLQKRRGMYGQMMA
jgi:hypothetical protein